MFEQTFVNVNAQTRKPWTVAASFLVQAAIVCALLIAPLLHIAAISPVMQGPITMRLVKTEPPPAKTVATAVPVAHVRRSAVLSFVAPRSIPAHIDMTPDEPQAVTEITGIPFGGSGVLSSLPTAEIAPPARPKPVPAVRDDKPLAVSSTVQSARLVFGPKPAYPPLARAARVEGTVRLRAVIARDGSISDLQLVSGPPLLVTAAMQAIAQWKYQPTILNNEAVPVATEVDVTFTLH